MGAVVALLKAILGALFAAVRPRTSLVLENLALRQQLAVLRRAAPRPRLRPMGRAFWVVLSRTWSRWTDALAIVKPATVVGWHRRGFARFWARKSRPVGRPPLTDESVEAVGLDTSITRLIRDRDGIYGAKFDARVGHLGIQQTRTLPRAPWQNGCAERFVGTLRRELLDHVIVLGERHLLHLVRAHASYYNADRPHMALGGDTPVARAIDLPANGTVVGLPRVGGLHHRYVRRAA